MITVDMEKYRHDFIKSSLAAGALKFGNFTLKSGRNSPYFFNSGMLNEGPIIASLASAYAALIMSTAPQFDVLFGPAYKGIPFAAATAMTLSTEFSRSVGFAYNRKEAKPHGEGGMHVGAALAGKRVLILDDVITAGTAVRESAAGILQEGGTVVGVVLCLDRDEVGKGETESARALLEKDLGAPVNAIIKIGDLISWLEENGTEEDVQRMKVYRERYGIKH